MGKDSNIEWTDHTLNPWIGCTKVSPGCANCYAEVSRPSQALKVAWGPGRPRHRTTAGNWRKPLAWDRAAAKAGRRDRVFCASLADLLDPEVPPLWLADLLVLINSTQNLDWLLLTKRPQLWRSRMEEVAEPFVEGHPQAHQGAELAYEWACGIAPKNVWMGTTIEDQRRCDERYPELVSIPAVIRFISGEPLLEEVLLPAALPGVDWVIAGGESGQNARPMHPDWARSLRDQCTAAGAAFLFKQWGEWAAVDGATNASKFTVVSPIAPGLGTDRNQTMARVGKKKAGRLLDGRTHDAVPVLA